MVPFTITRDVVCVNGGHGGSIDWLLEVSTVNNVPTDDNTVIDVETFKVTMEDRSLAKFMGLDCSKRKPFEGTTLIARSSDSAGIHRARTHACLSRSSDVMHGQRKSFNLVAKRTPCLQKIFPADFHAAFQIENSAVLSFATLR